MGLELYLKKRRQTGGLERREAETKIDVIKNVFVLYEMAKF